MIFWICAIVWILGIFIGAVACKCGLEDWVDSSKSYVDPDSLPIVILVWPISIPLIGIIYLLDMAFVLFDWSTTAVAKLVCPNKKVRRW